MILVSLLLLMVIFQTNVDFPIFLKNSNYSLLKNVLDQDVWRRNYNLRTIEGHNINDIIQAGLDNLDHPIGVVATSADAYSTFEEILISCANKFHKRNLNLSNHQKENYVLVKNFITEMEEFINDKCIEYEIISNRNINNYCFSSKISRSERKEVLNFLINSIKKIENEVFSTNGLFVELDKHESPRKMQFNEFLKSAGVYRDWPDGRAIYFNANNFFNVIINEEDHLKVILRQKNDKSYKKS